MKAIIAVACLLAVAGVSAHAAQIEGRVTNAQGAAVAGAKVSVTDAQGSGRGQAITGADGSYAIPLSDPGAYTVTVAPAAGGNPLSRKVAVAPGAEPVKA